MARIECPECGRPADDQDFACSHCELILNPNAPGGRYVMTQPSIVRALISPANFSGQRDEAPPRPPQRDPFDDEITTAAQVMLTGSEVPHLVARLDVELSEFEAYVVSFCDGETTAAEVAVAASLQMVELNAIVNSLVSRNILSVPGARSLSFRDFPSQPVPPPPPEVVDDDLEPEPTTPHAISYFAAGMDAEPELTSEGPAAHATPKAPSRPAARPPAPAEVKPPPSPVAPPAPSRPPTSARVPQVAAPAPTARPVPSRPIPVLAPGAKAPPRQSPPPTPARAAPPPPPAPARAAPPPLPPRAPPPPPPRRAPPPRRLDPGVKSPQDEMTNLLERAVSLERRGEVRGATELLKRGIATLPNPAPLYNKLALILLDQRRDFAEAEDLLQKAIDLDPDKTVYQKNLMRVVARAATVRETGGGKKSTGLLSKLFGK